MHDPENKLSSAFIESIVDRMMELNITQAELARRMNVSRPYIFKVLNHDGNLSFGTASKLASALGLDFLPVLRHSPASVSRRDARRERSFV